MSKQKFDAEQKADELLAALGCELGKSRAAYGAALLDDSRPDPPFYIEEDALKDEGKPAMPAKTCGRRRIIRRALVLAAMLILIMGIFAVSTEGVKLKITSLFFKDAPGSTAIMDNTKAEINVADIQVGYVPEGFQLVYDERAGGYVRRMEYKNAEGESVKIHISKTEHYSFNVDNERMEQSEILVNDRQAYVFNDGFYSYLVWQLGDCTIQISSDIDESELIEVAKNIIMK